MKKTGLIEQGSGGYKYSWLGVESFVRGLKNRRLARHLSDASPGGLLSKVAYKAMLYGTQLFTAGRFYPFSKTCNVCGCIDRELTVSGKMWRCACGVTHDRDYNAALNLRQLCRAGDVRTHAGGHGSGASDGMNRETGMDETRIITAKSSI